MTRISLTFTDDELAEVDVWAARLGLTRAQFVRMAYGQGVQPIADKACLGAWIMFHAIANR